jgi:hypothetical protein
MSSCLRQLLKTGPKDCGKGAECYQTASCLSILHFCYRYHTFVTDTTNLFVNAAAVRSCATVQDAYSSVSSAYGAASERPIAQKLRLLQMREISFETHLFF